MNMAQPINTTRLVFHALAPLEADEEHPLLGAVSRYQASDLECQWCGWAGTKAEVSDSEDARESAACPQCGENTGLHEPEFVIQDNSVYKEEETLITDLQVAVTRNKTCFFSLASLLDVKEGSIKVDQLIVRGSGTLAVTPKSVLRYSPKPDFVGVDSVFLSCYDKKRTSPTEITVLRILFLVSKNLPL